MLNSAEQQSVALEFITVKVSSQNRQQNNWDHATKLKMKC